MDSIYNQTQKYLIYFSIKTTYYTRLENYNRMKEICTHPETTIIEVYKLCNKKQELQMTKISPKNLEKLLKQETLKN